MSLDDAPGRAAGDRKTDLRLIAVLLLLVLLLRAWLLTHTVVPARDSIGYIRYALEFENRTADQDLWQTWQRVLRKNHQHPGYPLSILAVSLPVRAWHGGTDAFSMQLSAQLASGLAALLLVLPMYFLGKTLFDRRVAFWGVLIFQCLPISGHLLSDGVSEPVFLLFLTTALLFGVQAVSVGSPWRFALCGLFGGLAYLTRPEGALVLLAAGFALATMQMVPTWRRPWRSLAVGALSLMFPACAVGSLYWAATHSFTNKPSLTQIIEGQQVNAEPAPAPRTLTASVWAASIKRGGALADRAGRGLLAVASELAQCAHYFGAVPVVLGLVWYWRGLWRRPGFWVMLALCLMHTAVLCCLVIKVGYVSDRHVMPIVLCGSFFMAAALRDFAGWLCACVHLRRAAGFIPAVQQTQNATSRASLTVCLVMLLTLGVCLPKTLQPLHHNRAGHYAAGLWLADRLQPGDQVHDDHCWSHYYAGRVFEEGKPVHIAPGHQPKDYVVLTRSKDPEVAQRRNLNEAKVRENGMLVYHWPTENPPARAHVVVYAVAQHSSRAHGLVPRHP